MSDRPDSQEWLRRNPSALIPGGNYGGRMDDLSRAAMRYQTDKGPGDVPGKYHWYTARYAEILAPMRDSARTVLEIGVLWGASLVMWRDYFPNAQVIGVDCEPRALLCDQARVRVERADARDPQVRQRLVAMGPFDLVVDDASHELDLMRDLAVDLLLHAQVYIVEDASPATQAPLIEALTPLAGTPEVLVSRIPDHVALIYDRRA